VADGLQIQYPMKSEDRQGAFGYGSPKRPKPMYPTAHRSKWNGLANLGAASFFLNPKLNDPSS
jgi:hypothetical protein